MLEREGWRRVENCAWEITPNPHRVQFGSSVRCSRNPTALELYDIILGGGIREHVAGDYTADYDMYMGMRMVLHCADLPHFPGKKQLDPAILHVAKLLREELGTGNVWGRNKFISMRRAFAFTPELAKGVMSEQWSSCVFIGEIVALDEKLRKFRGQTPFIKKIPSKPDRIGHMITQMAVEMEHGKIPFVIALHPYLANKNLGMTCGMDEAATWACSILKRARQSSLAPVIVADCLYNTVESRKIYNDHGQKFIMGVPASKWAAMEELLGVHKIDVTECTFAENERTGSVACAYHSPLKQIGRKMVISTAHRRDRNREHNPRNPSVFAEYAATFSACNHFNHAMHSHWWPFHSHHWSTHIEDMILSVSFMNIYAAALDVGIVDEGVDFDQFIHALGVDLVRRTLNNLFSH